MTFPQQKDGRLKHGCLLLSTIAGYIHNMAQNTAENVQYKNRAKVGKKQNKWTKLLAKWKTFAKYDRPESSQKKMTASLSHTL